MKSEILKRYPNKLLVITVLSIIALAIAQSFCGGRLTLYANDGSKAPAREESAAKPDTLDSARLLSATINRIGRLQSISAELSLKMTLFDEEYVGSGRYEELAAPKNRRTAGGFDPLSASQFRLHIKMSPPASAALSQEIDDNILEIVCDQNSLWTYTLIEGEQRLSEINLTEMAGYLGQLNDSEREKLAASGVTFPASMGNFPALGGIAGTLVSLENWYDFDPVPAKIFFNAGTFPVWKITGRMKSERLESARKKLSGGDRRLDDGRTAHLPDGVEVYIGQKTPFPFRIVYFSVTNEEKALHKPLVTVDFARVYENVPSVKSSNFIYAPKINFDRITKQYLQQLIPGVEL